MSFRLRQENLEIFVNAIHASINEQLVQTYDGIFGFRLKCRVGILAFERRRQSRVLDRPLKLLVQLCCGLRRENLEIFADAIHASINEQLIQIYDGTFGFRLKCRVGKLGFERRRQSRVLDRTFQLLLQLCFGLRRENLEIFTQMQIRDTRFGETTTQYGVGPNFTVTSSVVLLTSTGELRNLRIKMLYRDSRLRETTTKSGLGPSFTVTSSVELWTSTREFRNFRGCHPCKLKCYIGIVGFEGRQQSRVLDRTLQLLVQLCFGLRRENLEIFADAIHASTNE
ncbi:hypothetical protein V1477_013456 [Vespula maculifrons]|uniref:Uncharacterized protein n=1 Tax=Vespula maculifrons TaxID=7453 RepID=A0ABD2BQ79_VESMC